MLLHAKQQLFKILALEFAKIALHIALFVLPKPFAPNATTFIQLIQILICVKKTYAQMHHAIMPNILNPQIIALAQTAYPLANSVTTAQLASHALVQVIFLQEPLASQQLMVAHKGTFKIQLGSVMDYVQLNVQFAQALQSAIRAMKDFI